MREGTNSIEFTVTDNLGASSKNTMILTVALGKLSSQENSVSLFPNPVKNSATLEINTGNPHCAVSIVITDSRGKIISLKSRKAEENKL